MVITLRFDTPPRHGSLKAAALSARMPYWIDLETWRLPYLADHEDTSFGSDAQTAVAQAVPLPLRPELLAHDQACQGLVRAGITAQVGAEVTFAPNFQFVSIEDPWLDINLRCLRLTRALAGDRPVGAWLHVTLDTMLSGVLPFAAERYARELPVGALVVLTVSDLRPTLSPEDLAIYFRALAGFDAVGLRVIVDRASEVSIPAVAMHAAGCMLGTRLYRTAPSSPIYTNDFNPRIPLGYFVGHQARRVNRDVARERHAHGSLQSCVHPGCQAVRATEKENIELRLHNAHELRHETRRARRLGASGLKATWRDASLKHLRGLAQAIELAEAKSMEA